jgi:uncharacterized LabA/DUF88 family protein
MKKIAVFVDVQNIYYTTKQAFAKQFNYRQFWRTLENSGTIVQAYAYAIDRGDNQQIKFQDALKHIGFDIRLKPFIQRADGSAKGDWDVGITIDVLEAAPQVDQVVLLSGDGDFGILMKTISEKYGVDTVACGVEQLTALSLIQSCNRFVAIDRSLLL